MNTEPLRTLCGQWRTEATVLRHRGAAAQAELLESVAGDLERRLEEWEVEALTIADAATESGYTEGRLRELVRAGRLPNHRESGPASRIFIRRRDLPRKPRADTAGEDVVGEMLDLVE